MNNQATNKTEATPQTDRPLLSERLGVHTYDVYGINGRGEIYKHATKPLTGDGDELIDDDGLGDFWAGNEYTPNVELTGGALAPSSDRRERG
jgi:hypothetical protein